MPQLPEPGVPVTVGVAETKTLAKLANRLAKGSEKADGVLDLVDSPHRGQGALAHARRGGLGRRAGLPARNSALQVDRRDPAGRGHVSHSCLFKAGLEESQPYTKKCCRASRC